MTLLRCAVTPAAVMCLLAGSVALAQTPAKPPAQPARPAAAATQAAPAASAASAARGFGTARGPILTRDELRQCLKQEDELRKRLATQESARAPLEQEKKTIADDQAAMRAERAKLEGGELPQAVTAFNDRSKVFTERRAAWEQRVKALNDSGRQASGADREALDAERAALEKELAVLETERKRVQAMQAERQEGLGAFNLKVRALDARVVDWNKRNGSWNDANVLIEADRQAWVESCGNRRYREDDEAAIRSGK